MQRPMAAALMLAAALAGCSKQAAGDATAGTPQSSGAPAALPTATASPVASTAAPTATTSPSPATCADYRGDLDDSDVAMIYYSTAGLPPPKDKWADQALYRIDRSTSPEEAWKQANAQVDAQWNAVAGLRCVSLRSDARIARYDAARGGLLVENFAPGTYYSFNALGLPVEMRIANADTAYVWKMPEDKAQGLLRGSNSFNGANIVARLRIVGARPSGSNGEIDAVVDSFDIVPGSGSRARFETVTVGGAA